MTFKKLTTKQRVAIIISTVIVSVGVLIIAQLFFSYIEVREIANGCYNNGGRPIIEKSGLSIDYFYCELD